MNVQSLALEVARIGGNQEHLDQRLASIDNRLVGIQQQMDQRFNSVDQRFSSVDQRFNSIDQRFGRLNQMLLAGWVSIMLGFAAIFFRH